MFTLAEWNVVTNAIVLGLMIFLGWAVKRGVHEILNLTAAVHSLTVAAEHTAELVVRVQALEEWRELHVVDDERPLLTPERLRTIIDEWKAAHPHEH